jgi:hypothetical protein
VAAAPTPTPTVNGLPSHGAISKALEEINKDKHAQLHLDNVTVSDNEVARKVFDYAEATCLSELQSQHARLELR